MTVPLDFDFCHAPSPTSMLTLYKTLHHLLSSFCLSKAGGETCDRQGQSGAFEKASRRRGLTKVEKQQPNSQCTEN